MPDANGNILCQIQVPATATPGSSINYSAADSKGNSTTTGSLPIPNTTLSVSPEVGSWGETFTVTGTGFLPLSPVTAFTFDGYTIQLAAITDASGTFTTDVTVPGLGAGTYAVQATVVATASTSFTIKSIYDPEYIKLIAEWDDVARKLDFRMWQDIPLSGQDPWQAFLMSKYPDMVDAFLISMLMDDGRYGDTFDEFLHNMGAIENGWRYVYDMAYVYFALPAFPSGKYDPAKNSREGIWSAYPEVATAFWKSIIKQRYSSTMSEYYIGMLSTHRDVYEAENLVEQGVPFTQYVGDSLGNLFVNSS